MKQWFLLIVGLILVGLVLWKTSEPFQPEMLDKSQLRKTLATQDSSYEQMTNHMDPSPYNAGPIQGMQTPFQVNQYRAYVQ